MNALILSKYWTDKRGDFFEEILPGILSDIRYEVELVERGVNGVGSFYIVDIEAEQDLVSVVLEELLDKYIFKGKRNEMVEFYQETADQRAERLAEKARQEAEREQKRSKTVVAERNNGGKYNCFSVVDGTFSYELSAGITVCQGGKGGLYVQLGDRKHGISQRIYLDRALTDWVDGEGLLKNAGYYKRGEDYALCKKGKNEIGVLVLWEVHAGNRGSAGFYNNGETTAVCLASGYENYACHYKAQGMFYLREGDKVVSYNKSNKSGTITETLSYVNGKILVNGKEVGK